MSGWYINPVGGLGVVTVASALLLVTMMLTGRDLRRQRPGRRWTLVALRLAVFLLIIAAMLRVTRVYTDIRQRPATLVLLVDRSKSMQTADAFGDRKRWDVVVETIVQSLPLLSDMGENVEVKVYLFDRELSQVEFSGGKLELGKTADGTESAIGAALEDVLHRETGKRIAGVILLSDGAQQAFAPRDVQPQLPVRQLHDLLAPLYTVTFGQDRSATQSRDVALTDLVASPSVFIKNELSVAGTARINGLLNQPIPVTLSFETAPGKMETIGSTMLRATQNGEQIKFEINFIPQTPGERKLTLKAQPQSGERITTNNELSTLVNVLDGGLNVLYMEGEPRAEMRYLRRSLASSPDIKVDSMHIDKRLRQQWPDKELAERLQTVKYNVYIIGDLDSSAFRNEDLQRLRDAVVKDGAGLIMLGGFHSFWAGGYQKTPLADVLPLEVRPIDQLARQDFDAKIREDLHLRPVPVPDGPGPGKTGIVMRPHSSFGYEPPMRLAARDENRQAWEKLPPLEGANKFEALKPRARPLAVTGDGEWLLVAAESGSGRVLAFAADSTWRWYLKGFEREHKRFWRQVILWLAKKDDADDQKVWLKLAQRRFPPAARIDFTVGARNAEGQAIEGAAFTATLLSHDGSKRPIPLSRQSDGWQGLLRDVIEPGDYTIVVSAAKDSAALGEAKARFIVSQQDLEMENSAARPDLMANLAKMTSSNGGEAIAPEQLPALLKQIKEQPRDREVATETKFTPWDRPEFFLLVVGLLCGEWYLRKRWGLV